MTSSISPEGLGKVTPFWRAYGMEYCFFYKYGRPMHHDFTLLVLLHLRNISLFFWLLQLFNVEFLWFVQLLKNLFCGSWRCWTHSTCGCGSGISGAREKLISVSFIRFCCSFLSSSLFSSSFSPGTFGPLPCWISVSPGAIVWTVNFCETLFFSGMSGAREKLISVSFIRVCCSFFSSSFLSNSFSPGRFRPRPCWIPVSPGRISWTSSSCGCWAARSCASIWAFISCGCNTCFTSQGCNLDGIYLWNSRSI